MLARRLFAGLRELDEAGVGVIVCPVPEMGGIGAAIRDRLGEGCSGEVKSNVQQRKLQRLAQKRVLRASVEDDKLYRQRRCCYVRAAVVSWVA